MPPALAACFSITLPHLTGTLSDLFTYLSPQSHVGEALPAEMVTRLFEGMRRVDVTGKTKGPSERISREQFTVSMSHLLKGNAEEKSLVILKMISATEGPVKAREVQKFTEDLVGSVAHVLNYRQELRGWTQKQAPGSLSRVQVLAAQLCSEMKLQGKCPALVLRPWPCRVVPRHLHDYGEKLLGPEQLDCDRTTVEDWVFRAPLVATFLSVVIQQGFLLLCSSLDLATLVPEGQDDQEREFASVLDVLSVIYINSHLPREQRHCWRLLFSSELHGHSFAQLCGRIAHWGPCVVLLEDRDGHVFGGFASCSWEVKPQFQVSSLSGLSPGSPPSGSLPDHTSASYSLRSSMGLHASGIVPIFFAPEKLLLVGEPCPGDDRCFLFSISPRMAVYTCTGYNDHYMYLNQGQQTIPNGLKGQFGDDRGEGLGLRSSPQWVPVVVSNRPEGRSSPEGMGGQHNYFGLWIDVDFGKGHSKAKPTCTTYNSPQLSAQEDFRFEKMEVWAVGDASVTQLAKNTKSVLDVDPAARALLEVSGRIRHSEGLREVPDGQ
ncbi:hypothetical protein J1605_006854 [Eschrichtius robustus]|uniref:MTOR-associated protein MEAK7 n=1 Tax=Eschrichtius robustus TaxID=9764 RepID=A0AB34H2N6_ESCRO|nr:hypothetical protein J1605_006854 [Eschrichtius robustus]